MKRRVRVGIVEMVALAAVAGFVLPGAASALETIVLTDEQDDLRLGTHLEILRDPSGDRSLDDVRSPELAHAWTKSDTSSPSFSLTEDAIWARFRLANRGTRPLRYLVITQPTLDDIRPFELDGQELQRERLYGDRLPFAFRDFPAPEFVLRLPLEPGAERTYYMRFRSSSSINLPVRLWLPDAFAEYHQRVDLLRGVIFGVIVATIAFNLFALTFLRDIAYLYFVLIVTFIFVNHFGVTGYAYQWLWPEWPWWHERAHLLAAFAGTAFSCLFAQSFLGTTPRHRILHRLLSALAVMNGLAVFVGAALPARELWMLFQCLVPPTITLICVTALRSLWSGFRPARFLLAGWILPTLGVILFNLRATALLPDNLVTRYTLEASIAIGQILVSSALVDRFRNMRDETVRALGLANRALGDSERSLERKVVERTTALREHADALERSQNELAIARDEALAANRAKSTFLANMSHELRTPLNAIIGYGELLVEETRESGHTDEADVEKIISAGRHLLGLINDVLDLSKIETGKVELFAEEFDVEELVHSSVATVKPLAERNRNRVEFSLGEGLGSMHSDAVRTRQILLNLLSNACKFTKEGGHPARGATRGRERGRLARIRGAGHEDRDDVRADGADLRGLRAGPGFDDARLRGNGSRPRHHEALLRDAGRRHRGDERGRARKRVSRAAARRARRAP